MPSMKIKSRGFSNEPAKLSIEKSISSFRKTVTENAVSLKKLPFEDYSGICVSNMNSTNNVLSNEILLILHR